MFKQLMHRRRKMVLSLLLALIGALGSMPTSYVTADNSPSPSPPIDLGTLPGARDSGASAVNPSGAIVGGSCWRSDVCHAFLYQDGAMTDLGTLPGMGSSTAFEINPSGAFVGWSGPPEA